MKTILCNFALGVMAACCVVAVATDDQTLPWSLLAVALVHLAFIAAIVISERSQPHG